MTQSTQPTCAVISCGGEGTEPSPFGEQYFCSDHDPNDLAQRWRSITTGPGPNGSRRPLDRKACKYFVYTLSDVNGAPIYVGRSYNVAGRLQAHASTDWITDVRSVSMDGPFDWDGAVAEEYRQIRSKLPRENRTGKPKGLAS